VESAVNEPARAEAARAFSCRRAQLLAEHQDWAGADARGIAVRLGLPDDYAEMLELAARLHDEGKRAAPWRLAFGVTGDLDYGKTTHRARPALLRGYRHELGSLPRAERDPRVLGLDADLRDLCLHLIAAHHGNARPLLATDNAEEPPSRLRERAQEIALRFARLERRWGPWGLAWWESLLRAADQIASRRNDEEGSRG
jgi:CRISPR-associated endonuclease/helicase Cas3